MRQLIKVLAVGVAIVVGGIGLSGPAEAVLWGSKSNPVYGYDSDGKFGKTYGNFFNEGGVWATSRSYQYDIQAGGNDVRVETDYYFHEWSATCGDGEGSTCWVDDFSLQTDPTDTAKWVRDYRRRSLQGLADAVRGGINICEIQRMSNDPCSPHAWVSFSY